jgi:hypothetical protein
MSATAGCRTKTNTVWKLTNVLITNRFREIKRVSLYFLKDKDIT